MASITLPRPSRKSNPANNVDLKTCLNKRGADKGQRKKRERSVLRPVHGEARIRRSSPTQVWWTEAAAAACTRQPIEARYNWRLSERGKKDLFGSNRILSSNKPILAFPPRYHRGSQPRNSHSWQFYLFSYSCGTLLVRCR